MIIIIFSCFANRKSALKFQFFNLKFSQILLMIFRLAPIINLVNSNHTSLMNSAARSFCLTNTENSLEDSNKKNKIGGI